MASYTEDHVQSWTAEQTVAIDKEMTQLSLAILGQTLFGEDIRNRDGPIREAGEAIADKTDGSSINQIGCQLQPIGSSTVRLRHSIANLSN